MIEKLRNALSNREISLYALSKRIGIEYELVRRMFCGKRKMTAEELILILDKTGIDFEEIK